MLAHIGHFINSFKCGSPNETRFVNTSLTTEWKFRKTVMLILINNIYTAVYLSTYVALEILYSLQTPVMSPVSPPGCILPICSVGA